MGFNCPYSITHWQHCDFFEKYFLGQGFSWQCLDSKVLQTMGLFRNTRDVYIDSVSFRKACFSWFPAAVETIQIDNHIFGGLGETMSTFDANIMHSTC